MPVADVKRKWFDAKRAELRARGLNDTQIAEQSGVKRSYFSSLVGGAPIGDGMIDRMCSAFGFKFPDPPDVSQSQTGPELERIQRALDEQSTLLQTLTKLIIAERGKA